MTAREQTADGGATHTIQNSLESLNIDRIDRVQETATEIYTQAQNENIGRTIDDIKLESAAVCLACRIEGEPWGAKDLADVLNLEKKTIRQVSWQLNSSLPLEVPPHDPAAYIDRYCAELNITAETRDLAHDILDACPPHFNSGTPTGIAASAVYGAAKRTGAGLTQREIAENADVSEVTIRNWYTEQLDYYDAD